MEKNKRERITRKPELLSRVALSDATIWRMERDGRFPKRIQLGGNSTGWIESEIDAWLDGRMADREEKTCMSDAPKIVAVDKDEIRMPKNALVAILKKVQIDELETVGVRNRNILFKAGIKYVGDLVKYKPEEILRLRNFGKRSVKELQDILREEFFYNWT